MLKFKLKLKQKQIFLILVLSCFLSSFSYSAFVNNRNWNTRARGFGGAYTAVSDDSGSILYNPAGLNNVSYSELYLLYSKPFADLDGVNLETQYFSFVQPLQYGTIAGNYYSFQDKDLYFENTAGVFYGFKPFYSFDFDLGAGVSFLEHGYKNVDQDDPVFKNGTKQDNYGIDAGALLNFENFSIGASAKNINKPDVGLKSKDIVPTDYRVGVAFKTKKLVLPIDLSYRDQDWGSVNDNKINKHFGVEWKISKLLAVRCGLNDYEHALGFSYMQTKMFADVDMGVDYSFSIPRLLDDTLGTHQFSMFMRFGYKSGKKELEFINYERIHPKFSIKKGISSVSNNTADLLFDNKLIYRFYTTYNGLSQEQRAYELAYKLSELIKFNAIFENDIKIDTVKSETFVVILDKLFIPVDMDALLSKISVQDLAQNLIDQLKSNFVIEKNQKPEISNVGEDIKVEKAYTVVGEIANIYIRDEKVFTIYTGMTDEKDKITTVFDKAIDFAKTMSLYLNEGLSAMIIGSSTLYDEYYITIKDKKVFYINSEADFLGVDKNKLLLEYQGKLYGALLK